MSKKICLMTLYNANNIGAYLQTYSTVKILKKLGYETYLVKFDSNSNSKRSLFKYIKQFGLRKMMYKYKSKSKYLECQKEFKEIRLEETNIDDTFILGSDECWNLLSTSFVHHKEYFGVGLENRKLISFASSANTCPIEVFKTQSYIIDFSQFKSLCVRDNNTKKIVESLSNRTALKIFDPTLIYEGLGNELRKVCTLRDFILVYSYGMTKEQIQSIKKFAKYKKKRIISVGTYNSWCNKNIICDPLEFLDYLKCSDYVITSTFHGAALSIALKKDFFVFCNKNDKIIDMINSFDISFRSDIISSDLIDCFSKKINYVDIYKKIDDNRRIAEDYLKDNL